GIGLSRWERATESIHIFTEADGLPSGMAASSIAEDARGDLWFGLYVGGLARYRDRRFKVFSSESGVPAGGITALHLDQKGRLCIASTQGGLAHFDDRSPAAPPIFISGLRIIGNKQPLSELGQTEVDVQTLSYAQNQLQVDFFSLNFAPGEVLRYQYVLEGAADRSWSAPTEQRTIT